MNEPSFPTLGEIAKFLFDCSGVLAQKGDQFGVLNAEKDKKSVQTALRRLAKEESELQVNLSKVLDMFLKYVDKICQSEKVTMAIGTLVDEVLAQYRDLVRNEGTYLDKNGSIKWVLQTRFVGRAALSSQKNILRFNIKDLGLTTPEDSFWFLPDISGKEINWPLAKAFKWVYWISNTNHTHFHFPGKNSSIEDYRLSQNLENASKWINDKRLPSWGGIYGNLQDSFAALAKCENDKYRRVLDGKTKQSISIVLFIARCTTYICKKIDQHFGRTVLNDLIVQYQEIDTMLHEEHAPLISAANQELQSLSNQNEADRFWFNMVPRFWEMKSEKIMHASKRLAAIIANHHHAHGGMTNISAQVQQELAQNYGAYITYSVLKNIEYQAKEQPRRDFVELYLEGEQLQKKPHYTPDEFDAYCTAVDKAGLTTQLRWLIAWIQASRLYRSGEHEKAFKYYQEAYTYARYAAGGRQYRLINQVIENCAKNNKWLQFKKAVAWANYLGIEVRWLRGSNDESVENLRNMFNIFKSVQYPIL